MKQTTVEYKGKTLTVEKREIYCKAGAYDHKRRPGWVAVDSEGKIVFGAGKRTNTICGGADRHDYPQYQTRKALLADINE